MSPKLQSAYNLDLDVQKDTLIEIVQENAAILAVLTRAQDLQLTDYYIGAGCIAQTVWNYLSGYHLTHGINDIDFVYYHSQDPSFSAEDLIINKAKSLFADIPVHVDIKNQARVHLWYEQHFGYAIKPYRSLEEAINSWPTTATAVGLRKTGERWKVYAPYGLNDLFGKIVRANKLQITKEIYEKKIEKWASSWSDLRILPWDK